MVQSNYIENILIFQYSESSYIFHLEIKYDENIKNEDIICAIVHLIIEIKFLVTF